MTFNTLALGLSGVLLAFLWVAWAQSYGIVRGSLATMLRMIWLAPFLLVYFPEMTSMEIPRSVSLKTLHVFIDDSNSMTSPGRPGSNRYDRALSALEGHCLRYGCLLKKTLMSELGMDDGYSPINHNLQKWMYGTNGEPWVIISDGGDEYPETEWSAKLRGLVSNTPGFIVGFQPQDFYNIWVESPTSSVISFEEQDVDIDVNIRRMGHQLPKEVIQVQVMSGDKALATVNTNLDEGQDFAAISVSIPSLPRGRHMFAIRALPTASESSSWDNQLYRQIEVLPDTVGVLHLLGSPSWDGRFMRRYFKAEPKYDLISFFILRDPWDHQSVNERELSLIPFPVDRLFNEELKNFRLIVIQNFTMYQFLETSYQENLVEFVKNGGGLLFLGGPRALQQGDSGKSPLGSILPFTSEESGSSVSLRIPQIMGREQRQEGAYFDEKLEFTIQLAEPTKDQRALASVYDDWLKFETAFNQLGVLSGIHHMENVTFKDGQYTPILDAQLTDGRKIPLAVASYPGKGRALWFFSDNLWQFALNSGDKGSRQMYHDFIHHAFTWLLRNEIKKPLSIRDLKFEVPQKGQIKWEMSLVGTATKYLSQGGAWDVKVCGVKIDPKTINLRQFESSTWSAGGALDGNVVGGTKCQISIDGTHPAFGSVSAHYTSMIPRRFPDTILNGSPSRIKKLGEFLSAKVAFDGFDDIEFMTDKWMSEFVSVSETSLPNKYKTVNNHYWIFESWLIYLFALGIPLEVLVRRWDQLVSK